MKYNRVILSSLIVITMNISPNSTDNGITKKKERAENVKIVLANLAQVIGNIGHIIEDRHNADLIESSVTNIVNNIVKITVNAIENKRITSTDAHAILQELEEICKDCDEKTTRLIRKYLQFS